MTLKRMLEEKRMSVYRLAKMSGVPYATCNDIVNGKTSLERCSAETVYKMAKALDTSMENILAPYLEKRCSFENFKSEICHQVKEQGDIEFIIHTLENREIRMYFERRWYPESLYLLAMIDYLSRINEIPLSEEYDDLRKCRLEKPVYPSSLAAMAEVSENQNILTEAMEQAIPEFRRFNIIENEVRNVA